MAHKYDHDSVQEILSWAKKNSTFHPAIDQLWEFRERTEGKEAQ